MDIRCYKCNKIVARLLPGSTVAKGTIMICINCQPNNKEHDTTDKSFIDMLNTLGIKSK